MNLDKYYALSYVQRIQWLMWVVFKPSVVVAAVMAAVMVVDFILQK